MRLLHTSPLWQARAVTGVEGLPAVVGAREIVLLHFPIGAFESIHRLVAQTHTQPAEPRP